MKPGERRAEEVKQRQVFENLEKYVSGRASEAFYRPPYGAACNQQCALCKKVTG